LPKSDSVAAYLRQIDDSRVYSNFGPLVQRFTDRLAGYFGVDSENVVLLGNGTLGLQGAVSTASPRDSQWIVPTWTFVATAQAVLSAGRIPYFEDVEVDTWTLQRPDNQAAVGTIVTSPFGGKMSLQDWANESARRPVIIDAASCFDSFRNLSLVNKLNICVMVSLHATKLVSTGEGGVVIGPKEWIAEIKKWSNFSFFGDRVARTEGTNAKLSEYQAAVGLASIDEWPRTRERWLKVYKRYIHRLAESGVTIQPRMDGDYVSSTLVANLNGKVPKMEVVTRLKAANIESRDWWGAGLHRMPAFDEFVSKRTYTNTDLLAESTIGLPLYVDMTSTEVDSVVSTMFNA